MRDYNDTILGLVVKHFGGGGDKKRSVVSLTFTCAMKVARKAEPEEFYSLFDSIRSQKEVDYFHKGFRQIDIFEIKGMDSLFNNIISLFGDDEWEYFQALMIDIISFNTSTEQ